MILRYEKSKCLTFKLKIQTFFIHYVFNKSTIQALCKDFKSKSVTIREQMTKFVMQEIQKFRGFGHF